MIGSTEHAGEESSRNKGDQGSHSRPKVLIAELYLRDHWEGLTNPKGSYGSSLEGKRTGELTPPPSQTIETPGEQDPPRENSMHTQYRIKLQDQIVWIQIPAPTLTGKSLSFRGLASSPQSWE